MDLPDRTAATGSPAGAAPRAVSPGGSAARPADPDLAGHPEKARAAAGISKQNNKAIEGIRSFQERPGAGRH